MAHGGPADNNILSARSYACVYAHASTCVPVCVYLRAPVLQLARRDHLEPTRLEAVGVVVVELELDHPQYLFHFET